MREAVGNDSDLYPLLVGRLRRKRKPPPPPHPRKQFLMPHTRLAGRQTDRTRETAAGRITYFLLRIVSVSTHYVVREGERAV